MSTKPSATAPSCSVNIIKRTLLNQPLLKPSTCLCWHLHWIFYYSMVIVHDQSLGLKINITLWWISFIVVSKQKSLCYSTVFHSHANEWWEILSYSCYISNCSNITVMDSWILCYRSKMPRGYNIMSHQE